MQQAPYKAIQKIILASMILLPFIPFVLSLSIGYYFFAAALESNTVSRMERIVSDHRQMIETFLNERKADLEYILHAHSYEDLLQPGSLDVVFSLLQKESSAFVDLGIFNDQGVHERYCGPFELTGKIYLQTDWFKEVMKRGVYISDIFLGYRKIPHFVIAVAREEKGRQWVLRATIDSLLFNRIAEGVRIGKTGEAYILSARGILQTSRRSGGQLMDKCEDTLQYPEASAEIQTFIAKDIRGNKFLYATAWMKERHWLLVARQKKTDAFKDLYSAAYFIVIVSIVGGAIILATACCLTRHIVGRMAAVDAEKDQLNRQLIWASRLAELGEMSAGFAHEINNPLQIIKNEHSLIAMILAELKEKHRITAPDSLPDLEESLDQIDLQIQRCARITQSILKFGRKSEPAAMKVDLKQYIPEVVELVAKKAGVHGIKVLQKIPDSVPPAHVDPDQLQQVLINLFNNAIDAILEKHGSMGGELIIEGRPDPTGMIEILVTDNGCGIRADDLPKVFTPFFTTKPPGKGTGLGLAVCYGIIGGQGGSMAVESQAGRGTTFTIRLPVASP